MYQIQIELQIHTNLRRLLWGFVVVEPCWFCLFNTDCSLRHWETKRKKEEERESCLWYSKVYKLNSHNAWEKFFLTLACFCNNSSRSSSTLSSATSNGVWPCAIYIEDRKENNKKKKRNLDVINSGSNNTKKMHVEVLQANRLNGVHEI